MDAGRLLLLDRGFYSVAVVRYLQAARHPFLMPVVCHGRSPKQPGGPSGSYVFRAWKTSGWSTYTLADAPPEAVGLVSANATASSPTFAKRPRVDRPACNMRPRKEAGIRFSEFLFSHVRRLSPRG